MSATHLQMLKSFSWKAIAQNFDKRRLQHDIDTHRLFLLTEYHAKLGAGDLHDIRDKKAVNLCYLCVICSLFCHWLPPAA